MNSSNIFDYSVNVHYSDCALILVKEKKLLVMAVVAVSMTKHYSYFYESYPCVQQVVKMVIDQLASVMMMFLASVMLTFLA